MNDTLERIWRKHFWPNWGNISAFAWKNWRKLREFWQGYPVGPGWNSNRVPLEYVTRALTLRQRYTLVDLNWKALFAKTISVSYKHITENIFHPVSIRLYVAYLKVSSQLQIKRPSWKRSFLKTHFITCIILSSHLHVGLLSPFVTC